MKLSRPQADLVMELNNWLKPYGFNPIFMTDAELNFLHPLKNAKIVALGEATHGTKEFFQMKHRVFRYLVEHQKHKIFAFEADFADSIYINNYVTKGEGNLMEIMKNRMQYGAWQTEEVKEMLEWMRNYNKDKKEEDRIFYFGFDCKLHTFQAELLGEYLANVLPELGNRILPLLYQVKNLSNEDFENMSEETYNTTKAELESLLNLFTANKDRLVLNSSLFEYEINNHLLRTFLQSFVYYYRYYHNLESYKWRDRCMAENALLLAGLFGQDTKITLWAHNGHIARDQSYDYKTMGYLLYEELGDLYQAVGFGFSQGSFMAEAFNRNGNSIGVYPFYIRTEPPSNSYNIIFHHARCKNYAFHIDSIPAGSDWEEFLEYKKQGFLMIGAAYNGNPYHYFAQINLREHYNWILYFDKTNAADRLFQ